MYILQHLITVFNSLLTLYMLLLFVWYWPILTPHLLLYLQQDQTPAREVELDPRATITAQRDFWRDYLKIYKWYIVKRLSISHTDLQNCDHRFLDPMAHSLISKIIDEFNVIPCIIKVEIQRPQLQSKAKQICNHN